MAGLSRETSSIIFSLLQDGNGFTQEVTILQDSRLKASKAPSI